MKDPNPCPFCDIHDPQPIRQETQQPELLLEVPATTEDEKEEKAK